MRIPARAVVPMAAILIGWTFVSVARAEILTADQAVKIALMHSPDAVNAGASVLDAKSGVYGGYSGVLPHVTASASRFNSVTQGRHEPGQVGTASSAGELVTDQESHGTTPGISGSWSFLNFSSLTGLSSARTELKAARHREASTRNDIAFGVRRQFYEVVKAVRLADVATGALKLARDDERRVHALFEVGSVSRSDLLKAQVRTAQSELDSLTAAEAITVQRNALAAEIGIAESQMGEVDTVLTTQLRDLDEASLVTEAAANRPDIMAAEAEVKAAEASKWSARLMRFPYLSLSGSYYANLSARYTSTVEPPGAPPFYPPGVNGIGSKTDHSSSVTLAVNWDLIDGLASDARNASATARVQRAVAARDALKRNLTAEVHQALLSYNEAVARAGVARRAVESAVESLKLTQQKYNVGSATILELIDAQVQLERVEGDLVSAAAAIRVAEAQVDRVRGKQV